MSDCVHPWHQSDMVTTAACPACGVSIVQDELSRLRAENEQLKEQLRLAAISEANAEAEANDLRAAIERKDTTIRELQDALLNLVCMAEACGWNEATTGRQILVRDARRVLGNVREE